MSDKPAEHTPTPWEHRQFPTLSAPTIVARNRIKDGPAIGIANLWMNDPKRMNADVEFIVRAVNCHDELVRVCEGFLEAYDRDQSWPTWGHARQARAALAKAKGTP